MGSAESVRQKVWAAGWESAADSLWQDLRYAARMLAKSPGFTAVAVLTLALGIGANAAIFSLVNAVLLRPLPYANPCQLVDVSEAKAGVSARAVSYPAFVELRDHSRVFASVAGLAGHALTLTGRGEPADLSTLAVTPEFFSLFGTKPVLGRPLSPQDGERGAAPVVVLSEQLWRSRFGADPGIAGTLDNARSACLHCGWRYAGRLPDTVLQPDGAGLDTACSGPAVQRLDNAAPSGTLAPGDCPAAVRHLALIRHERNWKRSVRGWLASFLRRKDGGLRSSRCSR